MPQIKRSIGEVTLPERQAKVVPKTDVLVVGGGPAGLAAAIGAAEAGAHVVLAERYGFLGGNATAGLVLTLASYYTSSNVSSPEKTSEFTPFPTDHGTGKPVIGGVLARIVEKLVQAGGAYAPSIKTGFIVPFDPEKLKLVALDMVESAGVELLLQAFASGVVETKGVRGVVFETKSGPIVVEANVIVDCTGDGESRLFLGRPMRSDEAKTTWFSQ